MKLSHIKLSGFKSFVDPTNIEIKGQLVGIVGPNGCGKSNVIDAVRWVLGESSAKQLRGESMLDIIFNGTINRKPVSRASVELVFDNQQKILTNAWNSYNEISIKRVLTRNGESIYYINNQSVRRKDITELFLGTGVGSKGYAVIEQGMISRIIDAKPEDLRMYLEEAAGVSKYREKRKETLSRLEYTRENLIRLEDIKSQLAESIEHLTEQAETAMNYQDLNSQLINLQLTQLLLKIDKARLALNETNLNLENHEKSLTLAVTQSAKTNAELDELFQKKAIEEYQLQKLNEEFNQLRLKLARLEERTNHKRESIKRIAVEKEQLVLQVPEINSQISVLNEAIENTKELIFINEENIHEKELECETKADGFSIIDAKYQQSAANLAKLNNKAIAGKHQLDLLNNTLIHRQQQLQNLEHRFAAMKLPEIAEQQEDEILKEQISDLHISLQQIRDDLHDKRQDQQKLEEQKVFLQKSISRFNSNIAGVEAKITTLEKLLKQSTVAQDLRNIVRDSEKLIPLWQSIDVAPGYEVAVEVAVGNLLSAVPIKDFEQVLKLPESKLVLWQAGEDSDVIVLPEKSLAAYVDIKDSIFRHLNSVLSSFTVAQNYSEAIRFLQQGIKKIVTKDGHLLTSEYIIFNAHHGNNSHVLEHQNQVLAFKADLLEQQQQCDNTENEYNTIVNKLKAINQDCVDLGHKIGLQQKQEHTLQLEYTRQEQIRLNNMALHKKVSAERELVKDEISSFKADLINQDIRITELTSELEVINDELSTSKSLHSELNSSYGIAKNILTDIELKIRQLHTEKQLLQQRLNSSTLLLVEKEAQLSAIHTRMETLKNDEQNLHDNDDSVEIGLMQDEINQVVENIESQKTICSQLTEKQSQVKQLYSTQINEKANIEDKLNQIRLKQQEYVLSIENLQQNLVDLNVTDYSKDELLSQNKLTLTEIQERISRLRSQVDSLGLVNLKAIEDLAQSKEKFDNLTMQIIDLQEANTSLEGAINQIDNESRKLLNDTYNKVTQGFNTYFKLLFGGGQARLALTEDDILTSGLHIYAEPLGKKNTSLHLLSGGEKALTAMSLVFALFSLNPAPFCLLDEVDAPLDDANTVRFCRLVKELSEKTQFVYISHNRLTMEIANQLVGVTMQEKGVSTTVSVSLVDAVKNAS